MLIAKREIVEVLLARRDHDRAIRADEELPELIHLEAHCRLIEDLGIESALLLRDMARRGTRRRRTRTVGEVAGAEAYPRSPASST